MFGLGHEVIITFHYGSWSSLAYSLCLNYDNEGNIAVFYYGYSTTKDFGNADKKILPIATDGDIVNHTN